MKKLLLTFMALASLLPARAQLFNPEALNGAMFGSLIGGLAGGNHGGYYYGCGNGFSGQGAAIGAGIGLAAGAVVGAVNQRNAYYAQPVYYAAQPYYPQPGYGYVSAAPVYAAPQPTAQPNYAVSGTLLGAASGALIGAGNCQAGKGAGIGAAAGLIVGSIAQYAAKKQEQKWVAAQTLPQPVAAGTQDSRPQTQDMSPQITSQPGPTSTYHWTPRPQIADAQRVPDAPTF